MRYGTPSDANRHASEHRTRWQRGRASTLSRGCEQEARAEAYGRVVILELLISDWTSGPYFFKKPS